MKESSPSSHASAHLPTLTCEVAEAQLPQAVVTIPSVIEEDGQSVAAFVQFGASHDAQILQWQVVELVQSHQHVAGHFSDRLRRNKESSGINIRPDQTAFTLATSPTPH